MLEGGLHPEWRKAPDLHVAPAEMTAPTGLLRLPFAWQLLFRMRLSLLLTRGRVGARRGQLARLYEVQEIRLRNEVADLLGT